MDASSKNQGVKVLVAGSILQLFLGIIYVWSSFVQHVDKHWADWDIKAIKNTSSYMLAFFVIGIIVCGRLIGKIGARIPVLLGGVLMSAGMFVTSMLGENTSEKSIWVTYGIIGGFGVGLAYNSITACAQKWFPQKRGLATGITVSAFGFGTAIFAPLVDTLVGKFELLVTFRILAVGFLAATLVLFSFIKLPPETSQAAAATSLQKQYTTGEMLKSPMFYLLPFSMMFLTLANFVINPQLKILAGGMDMGANFGTYTVMMTGFANAIGRIAVPSLGEKIGSAKAVLVIMAGTVAGSVLLCVNNPIVFVIAIALIVFCFGGSSGVYPVVTGTVFGVKNIGSNYGFVMIGFMIASLLIAPWVREHSQNTQFLIQAGFALAGMLLAVMLIKIENKIKAETA